MSFIVKNLTADSWVQFLIMPVSLMSF